MNVTVNGTTYQNVEWTGSAMVLQTEMTLSEIEAAFVPGANTNIIVAEGNQEVARYYNKGIDSIMLAGEEPRMVTVAFNLTQIDAGAEADIRTSIEDSDGAIEELAAIISDLSEIDYSGIIETLQSHQETLDTWFTSADNVYSFLNALRAENGILDQFNMRISALEHEVGIVSVVRNEEPVAESEGEE